MPRKPTPTQPGRGRRSSADLSNARLLRLANTAGITPRRLALAIQDTMAAWRELPGGRVHAAQLRDTLVVGLASAVKRTETAMPTKWLQAHAMADVLRAGVEALDEGLAAW